MRPAAPNFPFIDEGDAAMCPEAPNFPFIDEGDAAMCPAAPNFPFIDEGVACDEGARRGSRSSAQDRLRGVGVSRWDADKGGRTFFYRETHP